MPEEPGHRGPVRCLRSREVDLAREGQGVLHQGGPGHQLPEAAEGEVGHHQHQEEGEAGQ